MHTHLRESSEIKIPEQKFQPDFHKPGIKMKLFAAAILSVCLSGCGIAYKNAAEDFIRTQPESAWGSPPPAGHKEAEKAWIKTRLKDPESAQFRDGANQRVTIAASLTDPTVVPAWQSTIYVNAKNSYGGYTGYKVHNFYYSSGVMYAVESEEKGRLYLK